MSLTRIHCEKFTAFESITVDLSPGINVFVGANGTGKTHLMKIAYAACDISKTRQSFAEKLSRVFLPSGQQIGRLVKRQKSSSRGSVEVSRTFGGLFPERPLRASFTNHARSAEQVEVTGAEDWCSHPMESVYIPVKEMLSSAPGFLSLYTQREIHFEEIYADILVRAYLPPLRGPMDVDRKRLLTTLQRAISGKVKIVNEEFFLSNQQGNLEFTLLAEGIRKLALLWMLIQNGTLLEGAVLFWDEPETNLNPKMFGVLMDILLQLQRLGVQVFIATHDYIILKELDLRRKQSDNILYHSLYRGEDSQIKWHSTDRYLDIHPNAIAEAFADLYDREVQRALGGSAK